ncbi:hypothetical protein Goarm_005312, partial [Gossypium armourianum]|nr:hypothetical protein [Gossypium armourianum]
MSQTTSSLTPTMDPYGIQKAIKELDSLLEEVPKASLRYFFSLKLLLNKDKRIGISINSSDNNSNGDGSDDESSEILQSVESFKRLFSVA